MSDVLLIDVTDRVATITLNRPQQRNALSAELLVALPAAVAQADADDAVDVIILTGADPAFCAGLDLKEMGSTDDGGRARPGLGFGPVPITTKPLIGAINGVAVTGGLELALNCDFVVASERARFGDTHTRVGVMPGWGLTVLLPQAIGLRRAREMSFTGNFLTADEALQWGLVNRVVPHEELLPTARRLAADICSNDQAGVRQLRATYAEVAGTTAVDGRQIEQRDGRAWRARSFDPAEVERRRLAIMDRGRQQG